MIKLDFHIFLSVNFNYQHLLGIFSACWAISALAGHSVQSKVKKGFMFNMRNIKHYFQQR